MSKEARALRGASVKGQKPRFPYVEFLAVKFKYNPNAKEGEPEFAEVRETVLRDVSSDPNARIESIMYYIKKGWRAVGYGNLENPKYVDLRDYIDGLVTERAEVIAEAKGETPAPRGRPAPVEVVHAPEVSHGGTPDAAAADAGAPPPASKGEKVEKAKKDGGREAQV